VATLSASTSLSLYGRTELDTAARVTAALRVEPTSFVEIGGPHPDPLLARQGRVASRSFWIYEEPPGPGPDDGEGGYASLERLALRFGPQADVFKALYEHYEILVWVVVTVDRPEVTFSVKPELLARLARMRAELRPDIRVMRRALV